MELEGGEFILLQFLSPPRVPFTLSPTTTKVLVNGGILLMFALRVPRLEKGELKLCMSFVHCAQVVVHFISKRLSFCY